MHAELCVGAIVVDQGALLLIRRGREPGRGLWSVPGGRVEFGETLAAAVQREVLEETGLVVRAESPIGWVERFGTESEPFHFVIVDFVASLVGAREHAVAGDDADAVVWVAREQLPTYDLVPGLLEFLRRHGVC